MVLIRFMGQNRIVLLSRTYRTHHKLYMKGNADVGALIQL
jgi:hypothetical protein